MSMRSQVDTNESRQPEARRWALLDRYLLYGTESSPCVPGTPSTNPEDVSNLQALISSDGVEVVRRAGDALAGRSLFWRENAIEALAMCASAADEATRTAAFDVAPGVLTGHEELPYFVMGCLKTRGWGRGLRRTVQRWYNERDAGTLEDTVMRAPLRTPYKHRDLIRLGHPKPAGSSHRAVFKWIVDDTVVDGSPRLAAFAKLLKCTKPAEAAKLIEDFGLPRAGVPTELLEHRSVWQALMPNLLLREILYCLPTMTRSGFLAEGSESAKSVQQRLSDWTAFEDEHVGLFELSCSRLSYSSGHGGRIGRTWSPEPAIEMALTNLEERAIKATAKRLDNLLVLVDPACQAAAISELGLEGRMIMDAFRIYLSAASQALCWTLCSPSELPTKIGAEIGPDLTGIILIVDHLSHSVHNAVEIALENLDGQLGRAVPCVSVGVGGGQVNLAKLHDHRLDIHGMDLVTPRAAAHFVSSHQRLC